MPFIKHETPEQVAESLIGSSEYFHPEGYPPSWCEQFDELCFECEQCGWWCDISELSPAAPEERICNDCDDIEGREN